MQSLRNPKWLFLASTGPVALFLLLCYGEFSVIHTLLPAGSVALWQRYGLVLVLLALAAAGYGGVQWARRRPLGAWFSVVQLLAYSLWLCLLTTGSSNEVLPFSVPRWMVPTDPIWMAWTFLMPTLAHALLVLVAKFTPDDQPQHVAPNLGFAIVVPVGWAIMFQILSWISGLWHESDSWWGGIGTGLLVSALVLSTLSFFFFLVRAVYILTRRRNGLWADTLIWKSVVTIGLPVLGLAVNGGLFFGGFSKQDGGIFGNFSSPWFYVLAVLNGGLLCLPNSERPALRLLQLLGRSALFGYTFYFFLIFLPFLPLSIPAIILLGTGFLLLAPTLLFVVHVRQLSDDVADLRTFYPKAAVTAALVAGLAALPLYFTASYWHRRQVLHEALAYVYTPNYAQPTHLDASSLASTLAVIKQHKDQGRDFMFGNQLPYLSAYFNWLVLDNLMLSNGKIEDLERIFSGVAGPPVDVFKPFTSSTATPVLRQLTATSTYDARQQTWTSWVNMEVANPDPAFQNGEYVTQFALPPGCWVGDYYLTIGNRQERGILAEKKAATWVFAQILNEHQSRDPGLLAYHGPNEIDLRVYPVTGGEPRRTRIQFLHKEPCSLTIDGRTVALGDSADTVPVAAPVATPGNSVVYLSGLAKQSLPLVQRRPYYHFLVDVSVQQGAPGTAYEERLTHQLAQPLPNGAPARFSLVNTYSTPVAAGADWQAALDHHKSEGGFFLTGAIRRVLFEQQKQPTPTYPVIVVVTDKLKDAVLDEDFEDFSTAYPESDVFYLLGEDGHLEPHSLRHSSRQPLAADGVSPGTATALRAWPDAAHPRAYLPDTNQADIVLGQAQAVPAIAESDSPPANRWLTGLALQGYGQWQSFHPETADRERVPFIQASFRAGILTQFTAYLALENEAQKAALRRKQEQTLAANASLDTLEDDEVHPDAVPIDAGAGLLLLAGLLLAGWYLRRSSHLVGG